MLLAKRSLAALSAVLLIALGAPAAASAADIAQTAEQIEARLNLRIGLAVIDTGGGPGTFRKADERFAMASTFKALACAAALDGGDAVLDRQSAVAQEDLQAYSPVTDKLVGARRTTRDFCAMMLRTSDNTAANKVLEAIGGPTALTAFLRANGDEVTRLDRFEPDLNQATPGDPRDTTTPRAMAETMEKLVLGDALAVPAARQLEAWMAANSVAGGMLRASLPKDWAIADRGGAGGHGTRGIVAVIRPPARAPLVVAIYLDGTQHPLKVRDAAMAELGAAIVAAYSR
ncbi:class A beta-lactamase [Rhizobium sp. AAP43]|uniref:class A beta-lactamase n=1 Tax=Rhizobium sp. AAP43 TaxID=1523420 RepID=UPI0006B8ED1F|nr:class A beta-lactamase [Rhizobium sp. AAP43]KPF46986.1 hypothetical protein IP76_03305 [Rhizobium sp. AAP43]